MFAIFCKRRLIVPSKDYCIFVHQQQFRSPQSAVLVRSCSTSVCGNASEKTFTVSSYLINSCGLSSNDVVSASKRLPSIIKSPKKPDAVLKLLREYGFTDAHISRTVTRWPRVLSCCPNKVLLPKLQFFRSIGVPLPLLAQKVSLFPFVLARSLEKAIIPLYNHLKSVLGYDERVAHVFTRDPRVFGQCWDKGFSSNIAMLRERGVPQSSIITLLMYEPLLFALAKEKLATRVDWALAMGFDVSRSGFISAIRFLASFTESTLRQKMDIYRRIGWTESDINAAFLKQPSCMALSEKNITSTMDFLVNTWGCKPAAVAQCPVLLAFSLEKRIKPRYLVARILKDKGLIKNSVFGLLQMTEEKFLERCVVKYEKDIPELLDIYQGKLSPPEIGHFGQEVISE